MHSQLDLIVPVFAAILSLFKHFEDAQSCSAAEDKGKVMML